MRRRRLTSGSSVPASGIASWYFITPSSVLLRGVPAVVVAVVVVATMGLAAMTRWEARTGRRSISPR